MKTTTAVRDAGELDLRLNRTNSIICFQISLRRGLLPVLEIYPNSKSRVDTGYGMPTKMCSANKLPCDCLELYLSTR